MFVFGLAFMASAQGWGRDFPNVPRLPPAETITVSGSLIIAHGSPAITSGDVTYLISGLNRLIGFVDGLKEGAQVSVEGWAITPPQNNNLKFLRPSKLTLGGKTYDMSSPITFAPRNAPPSTNRYPAPSVPPRMQRQPQPQPRGRR